MLFGVHWWSEGNVLPCTKHNNDYRFYRHCRQSSSTQRTKLSTNRTDGSERPFDCRRIGMKISVRQIWGKRQKRNAEKNVWWITGSQALAIRLGRLRKWLVNKSRGEQALCRVLNCARIARSHESFLLIYLFIRFSSIISHRTLL